MRLSIAKTSVLILVSMSVCVALDASAQNSMGLRLNPHGGPTYPGMGGMPTMNINDAHPGANLPMPSGSPAQILQQNFPVPVKANDAETYMPAGLLERTLGPLVPPRREAHIY